MTRDKDEVQAVRDLLDETIGRTSYAEIARMLGVSPATFCDKLKRGSLRVSDLQKIAARMDKKIVCIKN